MSEQNFSGGVATEEPPSAAPEMPDTGSRRNLIVVAVAVVLALAVAVWFLFLSGGGSSTPADPVQHAAVGNANGAGNGKTITKPAAGTGTAVKPASGRDKGRDPFKPLLSVPTATPTPTPTAVASATPTPTPTPTVSAAGPSNTVATLDLTSIDSAAKTATFNVTASGKTTKYSAVGIGDTFATFFKVYDLGAKCAQVQYGDLTQSVCIGAPLPISAA